MNISSKTIFVSVLSITILVACAIILRFKHQQDHSRSIAFRTSDDVQSARNALMQLGNSIELLESDHRSKDMIRLLSGVLGEQFSIAETSSISPSALLARLVPAGTYGCAISLPDGFSAEDTPLLWWPLPHDPDEIPESVYYINWDGSRHANSGGNFQGDLEKLVTKGFPMNFIAKFDVP